MYKIIKNEWISYFRKKSLVAFMSLFTIFTAIISVLSSKENQQLIQNQKIAKDHIRQQWDALNAMNPHGAAHYGSYAFKKTNALNSLDDGVNGITGNVLRLEGHVQNEMMHSEASQSLSISKFGKLKPALLLQYVLPLFIIFLAFGSYSSERESGRLRLLIIQGISPIKLIFGKAFSVALIAILLLFFTIILQLLLNINSLNGDIILRLILVFCSYALYYLIVSLLVTYLSARLVSATATLTSSLAIWILWTIFLPKIWSNTVDKINPLPSRQVFNAAMKEDRSKGIDGHNPSDEREVSFKKEILTKYKVDSVSQLPINFDGLVMQADEDYGSKVWDKHFGKNYKIFQEQKKWYQYSGIINPFAALQDASMGFSGTDMLHHLDFLKKAENYRRVFIKTLNYKQAFGGSKTGDWDWKADNKFYKSVSDFDYQTPSITSTISDYILNIIFLLLWFVSIVALLLFTSKNIKLI